MLDIGRVLFQRPDTRELYLHGLPPIKEEVNSFARVRLSVCLSVSKITQHACMDLDEMLRVDRCRDMDELFNKLLSPIRIIKQSKDV